MPIHPIKEATALVCFVALSQLNYCIFSRSSSSSTYKRSSSRPRLCLATEERTSKLAGGGLRLSDSSNNRQSPSSTAHTVPGRTGQTKQNTIRPSVHCCRAQQTCRATRNLERTSLEKLLPVCISSACSRTCPWDALATSYPGALCPPPSHPFSPARASVCCGKQTPPPSHTLKKGQPSAVLPLPAHPITAAQLAYYVTKLPATTTH